MSEIKFQKPAFIPPVGLLKMMMKMGINPPPPDPTPFPENWDELSGDEKYEHYKSLMFSTEKRAFESEDIAKTYIQRVKRLYDAFELKEPDIVPSLFLPGGIYYELAGLTQADAYYDGEKASSAILNFQEVFNPDYMVPSVSLLNSGKALELLGCNFMRWPGGPEPYGLPENANFQYLEGENMPAEEYDELIDSPEGYMLRTFYPRVFDGLSGLSGFGNLIGAVEPAAGNPLWMSIGMGPVREALETIFKAVDLTMAYSLPGILTDMKIKSKYGTPEFLGGVAFAPFDIIGDTMRGTKGVMLDMYRCPDKLLEACDAVVASSIQSAVQSAKMSGIPFVFIPLHKGADGFMSNDQFEKFYWPSFKAQILGLIDEGLTPIPFVEGSYNQRLDFLADSDLPKGKTVWLFDQTDMKAAKEKIGSWACIGGNVPASLLATGTPEQIDKYCKQLIEDCAEGGGFILTPGAAVDHAKAENLHAFFNSAKIYGIY